MIRVSWKELAFRVVRYARDRSDVMPSLYQFCRKSIVRELFRIEVLREEQNSHCPIVTIFCDVLRLVHRAYRPSRFAANPLGRIGSFRKDL